MRVSLPAAAAALLLGVCAPVAADDTLLFNATAGTWMQDIDGHVSSDADRVDLQDDLGYSDRTDSYFHIAIEHPLPLLPNLRLQKADIDQSASGRLTRSIVFDGETYGIATDITSSADIEQIDLTAYYDLLDGPISLDLGLAARYVDGQVSISDGLRTSSAAFEGVLPMAYARVAVDLPLTGLWLGARAQGLAWQGEQLIDAEAQIGWRSRLGMGVELGYRALRLKVDEFDELDAARIDVRGPYAALSLNF